MNRRKFRYGFAGEPLAGEPPAPPGPLAGPRAPPVLTVAELTRGIRRILESAYPEVVVGGEVSGLSRPRSGHIYFTLRDDGRTGGAQVAVVLFREDARGVSFPLEDGHRVVVHGRVTVYEPRGSYQVIASRIEPDGQGALAAAFERLKARLLAEGLFAAERKRPLPFLPRRIGVITSPLGAALFDILRSVYRRHPGACVRILPVKVQGEGSAEEIAAALDLAGRPECGLDVVIVGRGGGAPEDLWAFNEERVVRAVAGSRVPTISAVGHEVDFTLSDFAADARAQTPTHAGELVVPDVRKLLERLEESSGRLLHGLRRRVSLARDGLSRLAARGVLRTPEELYRRRARLLDELGAAHKKALYNCYLRWHDLLRLFSSRLEALDPLRVLKRGYAVVKTSGGKVARRSGDLRPGEVVRILLGEGAVEARINRLESDQAE